MREPGPLDHLVPRLHVTPERGWLNDPNGPVHAAGRFHLFFQAHPHAAAWGPPEWGHVSSTDLVRWRRHPTALHPSATGPDRDGCWSGCVRTVDGRPTAFYTGVIGSSDADRVESVCRAHAVDDDLDRWQVDPVPLVSSGTGFRRDPYLWQDEDGWHLLLGVAGGVDHYRSPDATTWERTGTFFAEPDIGGRHWECPALVRCGDRDALVLSVVAGTHEAPRLHVVHAVGRSADGRFEGRPAGPLEHGDALYAPAVVQDATGRWLLWGWVRELVPDAQLAALGRVGALSLPFVCSLEDERLVLRPARELTALRAGGGPVVPVDGRAGPLPRQAEVTARVEEGSLVLELAAGGRERLALRREGGAVVVDRSASSDADWAPRAAIRVPVGDGPVDLRVLVDGSVVVVCVDGRLAAVTRVYPTSAELGDVRVEGDVSAIAVHPLSVD